MMKELGEKIKETRITKGLTQKDLADGICTQATISNLENGASFPALGTLLAISDRLNIEFSEIYEYTALNKNGYSDIFKKIRVLCGQGKYAEAYKMIAAEVEFDKLETVYETKQYYYYLGITSLLGADKYSDALYNFNLALFTETGKNLDIIDVLTTNAIGLAYDMNAEKEKAKTYFEKSISQLNEVIGHLDSLQDTIEITKVYYNSARFYGKIEEFKKALEFVELGIDLQQKQSTSYTLGYLMYEKGYILFKLGNKVDAEKSYFCAAALGELNEDAALISDVKKSMKEHKIAGYKYW
ncbi:helix-turn-helix domain-containing protein [Carnobacterium gallinarum]|uniref:helix-turn-helix domain-containing protein n=1 Tax=Carnobacterium gallinarum TaxID=2749 RepID=UPI000B2E2065|nr:helix-turn-helix transcriptional regulator [Carnobacterium gallinarum]